MNKERIEEAAWQIKRLERNIERNKSKLEDLKCDTSACRKAIKMWRNYGMGKGFC